jgi:hypothetical protein
VIPFTLQPSFRGDASATRWHRTRNLDVVRKEKMQDNLEIPGSLA